MGCVSEKPIVSKKIPVSILKKPGQKSNNATLANSAEIESIQKREHLNFEQEVNSFNVNQNPIMKRRNVTVG